jgi:hypothetical protein
MALSPVSPAEPDPSISTNIPESLDKEINHFTQLALLTSALDQIEDSWNATERQVHARQYIKIADNLMSSTPGPCCAAPPRLWHIPAYSGKCVTIPGTHGASIAPIELWFC